LALAFVLLTGVLVSEDKKRPRCHFFALRLFVEAFFGPPVFFAPRAVLALRLVGFFAADFRVVFTDFFLAAFFGAFVAAFAGCFLVDEVAGFPCFPAVF
jgi:hypothetical protein